MKGDLFLNRLTEILIDQAMDKKNNAVSLYSFNSKECKGLPYVFKEEAKVPPHTNQIVTSNIYHRQAFEKPVEKKSKSSA